jgi:hypothetical protein
VSAPGIFPGLARDDYSRLEGINHSILHWFGRSAAHARNAMINPADQTEAQAIGSAAHCAILEPDAFEARFVAAPKLDKRTVAGKAAWAAFAQANADKIVLSQPEWDLSKRLQEAAWSHATASELLRSPGQVELSVSWDDAGTGVRCKGRLDRVGAIAGWSVVADVKTTRDASRRSFERDIYTFHYHEQAAFYLDGLNAVAPHDRKFIFVAVEKDAPHCVAVYELDDDALELGRKEYGRHLRAYAECIKTGQWPGYGEGVDYCSLPGWAFRFHGEEG